MKTYLSDAAVFDSVTNKVIRTHPEWGVNNEAHPADRYYDFKADPSLIPRVLDTVKGWKDWSGWEGVQLFYGLLEWMNGPDSRLESSGCGFVGPHRNPQQYRRPGRLVTTGGLIFLFRDVALNLSAESAAWAARPAPVGSPPAPLAPGKNIGWLVGRSLDGCGVGFCSSGPCGGGDSSRAGRFLGHGEPHHSSVFSAAGRHLPRSAAVHRMRQGRLRLVHKQLFRNQA